MRAAIYCRISRDRKVDGGYTMLGVDRQEEDCRALCDSLGWEVAEVFVDNDISATSGRVRPAYKRMLQAARDGEIDAIVCWHPDRLYRRTVDLEELVEVCDKARIPVATVNAGAVDLTTPTGRLVAGLLAQVAKYEGEHKAERWKRSWEQRRKQGTPPSSGPRMYGWTREGVPIEGEAEVIRWVADQLLQGVTVHTCAMLLTARGVRTSRGNPWRATSLRNLMVNPRLAGLVSMRGAIVAESTWPPIITREQHEAIKAIVSARKGRQLYPRVAVLKGIAVCGVCGSGLRTGRRADKVRTYRCPPAAANGNGCVDITAEPLEEIVEAYAKARLADPRIKEELVRTRMDGGGVKIAQEIAALEARLLALETALVDGQGDVPELVRAASTLRGRIDEARERLAKVTPVHIPAGDLSWPESVERRNALIGLVVARVVVDRATRRSGRPSFQRDRIRIEAR